jgi:hypothetical protein
VVQAADFVAEYAYGLHIRGCRETNHWPLQCVLTTKFSDRTPTVQHAGARHQAAREARPPAAEHFMVMRLAATPG